MIKIVSYMACCAARLGFVGILVLSALTQGCSGFPLFRYGPDRQSLEEFEKRVEAAFRLQNAMTSEVMALQDFGENAVDRERLLSAEQDMQKACNDLNDYASREIDGQDAELALLRRVEDSVFGCEQAARRLQTLITKP